MSKPTSHDTGSPSLVPWLLGRFEPYSIRGGASPHLTRQAEDRLRDYIQNLLADALPRPEVDKV